MFKIKGFDFEIEKSDTGERVKIYKNGTNIKTLYFDYVTFDKHDIEAIVEIFCDRVGILLEQGYQYNESDSCFVKSYYKCNVYKHMLQLNGEVMFLSSPDEKQFIEYLKEMESVIDDRMTVLRPLLAQLHEEFGSVFQLIINEDSMEIKLLSTGDCIIFKTGYFFVETDINSCCVQAQDLETDLENLIRALLSDNRRDFIAQLEPDF